MGHSTSNAKLLIVSGEQRISTWHCTVVFHLEAQQLWQHKNGGTILDGEVSMEQAEKPFCDCPIKGQLYAEVEPTFNAKYFDELPETWALVDENGNIHEVQYNKSLTAPLLTNGWEELRGYYGMTGDHMVWLGYMGDDLFKLRVFQGPIQPKSIPTFHSCCSRLSHPSFTHTLSKLNATASHLVKDLPRELGTHVRSTQYESLMLIGPTGAFTECKVLIQDGNKKSTKIGKGWKDFCKQQNLKSGDVLKFVFIKPRINNAVKVEKVTL